MTEPTTRKCHNIEWESNQVCIVCEARKDAINETLQLLGAGNIVCSTMHLYQPCIVCQHYGNDPIKTNKCSAHDLVQLIKGRIK